MGNPFAQQLQALENVTFGEWMHEAALPPVHHQGNSRLAAESRIFHLVCQPVHVIALRGPAITTRLESRHWLSLIYVESGEVDLSHSQHRCFCAAGDWLLVPGSSLLWNSSAFSIICLTVSPELIAQPLKPCNTEQGKCTTLDLPEWPRAIHSHEEGTGGIMVEMAASLLHTTSQLYLFHPELLERLAIGEQLCRLMAVLICPTRARQRDTVEGDQAKRQRKDSFDELVDYIKANLDQPLNLTVLATHSHYSRRALQYAFRERLGCTATQWIRSQRLDLAQQRLQSAEPGDTVTRIALACGYRSLSLFSIEFQHRFHIKPSVLLRRTRSGHDGDGPEHADREH
ncbi:MAG: AraC family transcriptional regulator [Cyanobium sp.]|nr:AraC family transcriptional regulator [Cyanobium sp.]